MNPACRPACILVLVSLLGASAAMSAQDAQKPKTPAPKAEEGPARQPDSDKRVELNLLGKTDAAAGESRRNENVSFNLVDNNALKELGVRLGTTATLVREFLPSRNYFGAEYGNAPSQSMSYPAPLRDGLHGSVYYGHQNSVLSARSFFQVGDVKPARESDFGFTLGSPAGRRTAFYMDASSQRLRGSVNGNVLVPRPDERTPLATDPAARAIVTRYLSAYPAELPNRTDINPRALNTSSPQAIDSDSATARVDRRTGDRGRVSLLYSFTGQTVDAFQLVAGQNPNTSTKSHRARAVWTREWGARLVFEAAAGYDRIRSLLMPDEGAVGQMIAISGLETLGPPGSIPIDRAQNLLRYSGLARYSAGRHAWSLGAGITRRQFNGVETDTHRGYFGFSNDFGRDAVTNMRMGKPSQFIIAIGDVRRGFRNWDIQLFAGDSFQASKNLRVSVGLRYEPSPRPTEVNNRNAVEYDCDCNNVAPSAGLAYRLPGSLGLLRSGAGFQFGQIFPVTFSQIRFSPPGSVKFVVTAPDILDPLGSPTQEGARPEPRPNLYLLDPQLTTPYSYQYNLSWEPDWSQIWRLQVGYVGSRQHKLLVMWYLNRGRVVPGIPQTTATINQRRADQLHAEHRLVVNGSRGCYDAGRITFVIPERHGFALNASYWLSKAIDLGASYTNTGYDVDTRISRSQSEYENHRDMKGPSAFDQPHAFLGSVSWALPVRAGAERWRNAAGGWRLNAAVLLKSGTPFNVVSGSDAPGYGNVDGNGNDRPNLLDPTILGRTVGNPDTSSALLPRKVFYYMAPTDARGNLGRNTFRKGGIRNVNASLSRTWEATHGWRITFRAESINLLNTPQFAEPGFEMANPNFGHITNTLNDGRTLRFHIQASW